MFARWPRASFYLVTALALFLDQATKAWAIAALRPLGTVPLLPGLFSLTYVQNRGIAFGMFQGESLLVGVLVAVLVLVALFYMRGVNWAGGEPNWVGGMLCGGALGNLVDRARLGFVVDFFDAHLSDFNLYWPVFNVADSLICTAVGWIVLRQLWDGKKKQG